MLTLADFIAQFLVGATVVVALMNRHLIDDMSDGNVERLEREERAEEAQWWLRQIRTRSMLR